MATPPQITPEQREAALVKAGEVRRVRAELKNKLKMGIVSFDDVLAMGDDDEMIGRMKILAVLESIPGVGKVKARRTMDAIGIAHSRSLRGLGTAQRRGLLDEFGG
jgi:hypothetical protein